MIRVLYKFITLGFDAQGTQGFPRPAQRKVLGTSRCLITLGLLCSSLSCWAACSRVRRRWRATMRLAAQQFVKLLAMLGMSTQQVDDTCQYCETEGVGLEGAAVRAQQLLTGVERRFIDKEDALHLMREQPQIFRCDFETVHESEHIVCVNKPNNVLLRLSEKPSGFGSVKGSAIEPSIHEWLSKAHPSVLTETGTTRICHNLDFATSGGALPGVQTYHELPPTFKLLVRIPICDSARVREECRGRS